MKGEQDKEDEDERLNNAKDTKSLQICFVFFIKA